VTRPFAFEGKRRMMQAERGMQELLESVDTLIVIPNEKLLAVAKDAGFFESFRIADDVLRQGVQGISDIITIPGVINRDFADVKTTMAGMGYAVMGTAVGRGNNRAMDAAVAAMASPLLEAGAIDGARGILINITGSSNLKLTEVNEASTIIQNAAHEDCNIIFGAVQDERMGDEVKITVIATGFRQEMPERRARMLAESTMPGADFQVPIRGRSLSGRSEAPAMFASEEKEQRQTPAQREMAGAQQIAIPQMKTIPQMKIESEAVEAAGGPAGVGMRQDGLLQGGRIWVSPQEVDETIGWDDEVRAAADAEIEDGFDSELEAERSVDREDMVGAEDAGHEFGPELVPVAASVFDDDFFRTTYVGGRPVVQEEVGVAGVSMETAQEPALDETGILTEAKRDARLYAGATATHAEPAESDELDIPAFLRRSR